MAMLEKLRVVFLTVKYVHLQTVYTMKEHDHTNSPNLDDKQAYHTLYMVEG